MNIGAVTQPVTTVTKPVKHGKDVSEVAKNKEQPTGPDATELKNHGAAVKLIAHQNYGQLKKLAKTATDEPPVDPPADGVVPPPVDVVPVDPPADEVVPPGDGTTEEPPPVGPPSGGTPADPTEPGTDNLELPSVNENLFAATLFEPGSFVNIEA